MRMSLRISLWGMLVFMVGCQGPASRDAPEKTATLEQEATLPVDEPATCSQLNIPTYDGVMKDLSALRCDACHNETFAWEGIVLTQYDAWKTYIKPIRNRIFYNLLSQPLEPGEQELFLRWIDAGVPRTDADCTAAK